VAGTAQRRFDCDDEYDDDDDGDGGLQVFVLLFCCGGGSALLLPSHQSIQSQDAFFGFSSLLVRPVIVDCSFALIVSSPAPAHHSPSLVPPSLLGGAVGLPFARWRRCHSLHPWRSTRCSSTSTTCTPTRGSVSASGFSKVRVVPRSLARGSRLLHMLLARPCFVADPSSPARLTQCTTCRAPSQPAF